jgi:hypothetical protein
MTLRRKKWKYIKCSIFLFFIQRIRSFSSVAKSYSGVHTVKAFMMHNGFNVYVHKVQWRHHLCTKFYEDIICAQSSMTSSIVHIVIMIKSSTILDTTSWRIKLVKNYFARCIIIIYLLYMKYLIYIPDILSSFATIDNAFVSNFSNANV